MLMGLHQLVRVEPVEGTSLREHAVVVMAVTAAMVAVAELEAVEGEAVEEEEDAVVEVAVDVEVVVVPEGRRYMRSMRFLLSRFPMTSDNNSYVEPCSCTISCTSVSTRKVKFLGA